MSDSPEPAQKPEYTVGQLRRIGVVYDTLARLLPTEGRDYAVDFVFDKDDPGKFSVRFRHYNELGKLWCDYCTKALKGGSR